MTDSQFYKIQLLATSREYLGIEQTMTGISKSIPMANVYVETDIQLYVGMRMQTIPRFKSWPPSLREETERRKSTNANGMFRWAVCQLDILWRFGSSAEVIKALRDLPATLDETYHRIFSNVARKIGH